MSEAEETGGYGQLVDEMVWAWEPINRLRARTGLPEHPGGDFDGDLIRLAREQRFALEAAAGRIEDAVERETALLRDERDKLRRDVARERACNEEVRDLLARFCATDPQIRALEAARHELIALHGLVACDGAAPEETWSIDTSRVLAQLDAVLPNPSIPK